MGDDNVNVLANLSSDKLIQTSAQEELIEKDNPNLIQNDDTINVSYNFEKCFGEGRKRQDREKFDELGNEKLVAQTEEDLYISSTDDEDIKDVDKELTLGLGEVTDNMTT